MHWVARGTETPKTGSKDETRLKYTRSFLRKKEKRKRRKLSEKYMANLLKRGKEERVGP